MKGKQIIVMIVMLLCAAGIFWGKDWRNLGLSGEYQMDKLLCAAKDGEGNLYVAEQSGENLLKVDPSGTLQWRIQGFLRGVRLVCDGQGNIYVHVTQIERGIRVVNERIAVYSPEGEYLGDAIYFEYDEPPLSSSIVGMSPKKNGVTCFLKEKDDIARLECVIENDSFSTLKEADRQDMKTYELKDAGLYVRSVSWNPLLELPCYVTYDGKVCVWEAEGKSRVLYDSDTSEDLSIPYDLDCDASGNIFVTDVGKRRLLRIDPQTGAAEEVGGIDPEKDAQIAYSLDVNNGITACTNYAVKVWQGDEVSYISSAHPATRFRAAYIGFRLSVVVLSILLLIGTVLGLRHVILRATKFTRVVVAMVAGVLTVGLLFMSVLFPKFMKQITDSLFRQAQLAAALTAQRFPYDSFERLDRPSDYMKEDYRAVKDCVEEIFLMDDDCIDDLYCTMYSVKDDGLIVCSYTLENTGAIYPYDWEYEGSEEQNVITTREGKTFIYQATEGSYQFILNPLINKKGEVVGLIEVGTDLDTVVRENYSMMLDMFITILAMMVAVILLVMEVIYFSKGRNEMREKQVQGKTPFVQPEVLRMITFLIFFLTNLATSFLPVYAMKISSNAETFGIPAEVLAAIPISAEVLSGAVFSILGVGICEKLGNGKAVVLAGLVFAAGFGLRVVPNIWILTLGNALLGLGWGIILLLVNTKIAMMPEGMKDEGFSHYNAAGLNGVNGGVVFGGFLVQWISYRTLFIVTAVLSLLVLVLAKKYLSDENGQAEEEEGGAGEIGTVRFLFQPRIIGYFMLLLVPVIACGYYLNYMYPIIGAEWGLSETNIGYSYLLNGLCVMLLSGTLTNAFHTKKRQGLVLSVLLYVMAFVIVAQLQSIPALFAALVLLGVSDSFGLPLLTSYFTDEKLVERYGYDRAMGIYSLFENGAQAAGSFVFSYVLLIGVKRGLLMVSGVLLVTILLFSLMAMSGWRKEKKVSA